MIRRLRRRMTLLVLLAVLLVTAGIVAAISFVNYSEIDRQAGKTLAALVENGGRRFALPESAAQGEDEPPEKPDGEAEQVEDLNDEDQPPVPPEGDGENGREPLQGDGRGPRDWRMQPRGTRPQDNGRRRRGILNRMSAEETASLSNTFTAILNEDGSLSSWESARSDLWGEEEVRALCREAASAGGTSGRVGSRYYMKGTRGLQPILVVLDARLELESARRVALITAGAGAVSCILLGLGAWLLVRRMTRPVEEAFLRQQRFVQDAGHEMKTPLAIISSHAQVLEGEYGESESLTAILSEVQRTSSLVSQLLTLSKLDREPEAVKRLPFDLGHTALEAALSFESAAFEAGFMIETEAEGGVVALGDETMTRRLLMILLDNAVKYGEPRAPIRVSVQKRRKTAVLAVRNAGEDIPPEAIQHLFDRFYRADAAHSRGKDGSGLGLAIAQELARAMDGEITCESGGGETVFTLTLAAKQK